MLSLKDCDYKEYLNEQPAPRSYLEELQKKAQEGDPESKMIYRKQIYSLAAYLAREFLHEYMAEDELFRHINARELEEISYLRNFFFFLDQNSHLFVLQSHIDRVIERLYTTTLDGKYILKEQYDIAAKARKRDRADRKKITTVPDGVPKEIAAAVRKNETRIEREKVTESRRFGRLKKIVRDCEDLSYREKLNMLSFLTKEKEYREFFYLIYGADDGIIRTPEEAAKNCDGIPAGKAEITFQAIINKDMSLFTYIYMCTPCVMYSPNKEDLRLISFLCANEKNRMEHRKIEEKNMEYLRSIPRRSRHGLRDYLD